MANLSLCGLFLTKFSQPTSLRRLLSSSEESPIAFKLNRQALLSWLVCQRTTRVDNRDHKQSETALTRSALARIQAASACGEELREPLQPHLSPQLRSRHERHFARSRAAGTLCPVFLRTSTARGVSCPDSIAPTLAVTLRLRSRI